MCTLKLRRLGKKSRKCHSTFDTEVTLSLAVDVKHRAGVANLSVL